jgi:hypothetical protein
MVHEAVVGCEAIMQQDLLELMAKAGFVDVRVADQPKSARFVVIGAVPSRAGRTLISE